MRCVRDDALTALIRVEGMGILIAASITSIPNGVIGNRPRAVWREIATHDRILHNMAALPSSLEPASEGVGRSGPGEGLAGRSRLKSLQTQTTPRADS